MMILMTDMMIVTTPGDSDGGESSWQLSLGRRRGWGGEIYDDYRVDNDDDYHNDDDDDYDNDYHDDNYDDYDNDRDDDNDDDNDKVTNNDVRSLGRRMGMRR